ncbi:MAG TPA: 4-alpha-glucanotransferase [Thermoanaerobaculia bacterium]|nr:4-alpha-glucanotransferase [Thermoanaerobaculia bacterium]
MSSEIRLLQQLARLYDIQSSYLDVTGIRRLAGAESLRALIAIRSGEESLGNVPGRIRRRVAQLEEQWLEPVTVFWEGRPARIAVKKIPRRAITIEISGEGIRREMRVRPDSLRASIRLDPTGEKKEQRELIWREPLQRGYYDLSIESGKETRTGKLFVAPISPHGYPEERRQWGVFAPVYALWDAATNGCGTLRELREVIDWARQEGASYVATLPLLASFLGEEHFDPSPYAPVSRLFWNELFIDMKRLGVTEAQHKWPDIPMSGSRSTGSLAATDIAGGPPNIGMFGHLIDYRSVMAQKRARLEEAAADLYASNAVGQLEDWVRADPTRTAYAAFRAKAEAPFASNTSRTIDPERYHLFVQWVMDQQMTDISSGKRTDAASLYLDFPLGTHPDGFDVGHFVPLFAPRVSAGAPPDLSYKSGQDWGFPPMQPDVARADGYDYFIRCIDFQMKHAAVLRIDHVMSLHRLFWVPSGFPAAAGAYVRYRAEELYAILLIESHRHGSTVVGEDLGTVPAYVRRSLDRHDLSRLFVVQRQLTHSPDGRPGEIRRNIVASLNNHDMAPFAAFWQGLDVEERLGLRLISDEQAERDRDKRELIRVNWKGRLRASLGPLPLATIAEIFLASVQFLAKSDANTVLIGLEDLWLETEPQNIPTTTWQRPNWRHMFQMPMEEWSQSPLVRGAIDRLRDRQNREGAT